MCLFVEILINVNETVKFTHEKLLGSSNIVTGMKLVSVILFPFVY